MPALRATEFFKDGERWLRCHHCGYEWPPRKKFPKQCPACKRSIYISEKMEQKQMEKITARLPETGDVREVVPDIFTPQCVRCGGDATVTYKKMFYCGVCVIVKMKEDGVIEE